MDDETKKNAARYLVLRNGGRDAPDIDWLMELTPEGLDEALDAVLAERAAVHK